MQVVVLDDVGVVGRDSRHQLPDQLPLAGVVAAARLEQLRLPRRVAHRDHEDAVPLRVQSRRLEVELQAVQLVEGEVAEVRAARRDVRFGRDNAGDLSTMVAMGLLGALIVFSGRPLYAPHWGTASAWGLTPVEDQQIAGLLMWVAAGGIYLILAAVLLYRALQPPATTRAA